MEIGMDFANTVGALTANIFQKNIYHCELNPKGLERLKLENFEKRLKENEASEK
jgi:hypothetical protein